MPHILVACKIRLQSGPTLVGDESSNPALMAELDAVLQQDPGDTYAEYRTELPPRIVLDRLQKRGYSVVGQSGIGQTCVWTLVAPI